MVLALGFRFEPNLGRNLREAQSAEQGHKEVILETQN